MKKAGSLESIGVSSLWRNPSSQEGTSSSSKDVRKLSVEGCGGVQENAVQGVKRSSLRGRDLSSKSYDRRASARIMNSLDDLPKERPAHRKEVIALENFLDHALENIIQSSNTATGVGTELDFLFRHVPFSSLPKDDEVEEWKRHFFDGFSIHRACDDVLAPLVCLLTQHVFKFNRR